ncbi:hypothetical protein D3C77_310730 [compost metagenome]
MNPCFVAQHLADMTLIPQHGGEIISAVHDTNMQHPLDTQAILNVSHLALSNHLTVLNDADLIHHLRKLGQNMR